jgi:predicted kinase
VDKVIMLCGPAASGKSHYAKNLIASLPTGVEVAFFSPDKWLDDTSEGAYNWTEQRAYKAWATEYQRFTLWMLKGWQAQYEYLTRSFERCRYQPSPPADRVAVWDATFVLSSTRSPVTNFAKGFGIRVEAVAFRTDPEECIWRNSQRPSNRKVPDEKIREMIERFQQYGPTLEEGFDLVTEHRTPRLRPEGVSNVLESV